MCYGDERRLEPFQWGFIPSWAKTLEQLRKPINARSETAADKPMFRKSFRSRRCLVPATGFYEWQKIQGGKQPYCIQMSDGKPFAFAGLWDEWTDPEGEVIRSMTILTCEPNTLLGEIHNRMPVILSPETYDAWLDPQLNAPPEISLLLCPYPAEKMSVYPVSKLVNNPQNDDPRCVAPITSVTE